MLDTQTSLKIDPFAHVESTKLLDRALETFALHPMEEIEIPMALDLRSDGQGDEVAYRDLQWLCILREACRRAIKVRWSLKALDLPSPALVHLPPCVSSSLTENEMLEWRKNHLYGRLYWRFGGTFLTIKDRRRQVHEKVILTILDPDQIEMFRSMSSVVKAPPTGTAEREFLDELIELQLAIRCENWCTALPFRMTHWPVPNHMI